jgi:hypothetical protein
MVQMWLIGRLLLRRTCEHSVAAWQLHISIVVWLVVAVVAVWSVTAWQLLISVVAICLIDAWQLHISAEAGWFVHTRRVLTV